MPNHRQPHYWAIPLKRDWGKYCLPSDAVWVPIIEAARPEVVVCIVMFRTSWPYTLKTAREIVRTHNKQAKEELHGNTTPGARLRFRSPDDFVL